jgi:hypothetical protein
MGGNTPQVEPLWGRMQTTKVDLVLTSHDHHYERFDPVNGVRHFIVGSGGASHHAMGAIQPGSVVRNNDTYGILKLTLRSGGYDWQFIPEAGKSFTDSGSGVCS